MKRLSTIVRELIFGIILFGIIVEILILALLSDKIFYSVGLLIGIISAILMTLHMNTSMEEALEMEEAGADKHIKKTYAIRTIAVLAAMYIVYISRIGSVVSMFIGIMGLKVAAYIQPITNKYFTQKIIGKGR